jgi:Ca-activated chloride channel family protein
MNPSVHSLRTPKLQPLRSRKRHRLRAALAVALIWLCASGAAADDNTMPELIAILDGREVPLPSLKADFDVEIQGDLASVRVTQVFENPYDVPLHARYIFPLPSDAAVYAMRLISGDQMIEAEIQEKQEAKATFEAAKSSGKQAALLDQHRPNVFTQEVANLMPGLPIRVELEYAHVVEKSHGAYRFHIPTVVGPRFLPEVGLAGEPGAPTRRADEPEPLQVGRWNLPASPPVAAPERVDRERISIRVALDAGMPIQWMESPTHRLAVDRPNDSKRSVELASERTVDNKDFELNYRLGGTNVSAGLTTFIDGEQGFLSLLLEPPENAGDAEIAAREMVFVLDCSGSMSGTPLSASKRFMRRTLRNMRPADSFRIIRFSDSATEWSGRPVSATPANLAAGENYVDSLYGSGGTHMASGIRAALAPPIEQGVLRIVVFLTDGYIGNDIEIIRLLDDQRGEARLFSFGVGNSVNRYLIEEMARVGRGAARIVLPTEDAQTAADELVERLAAPILTDIQIDWGNATVDAVFPREIPDLFLGQTLRIMGRYHETGSHRVTIEGKVAGRPVSMPLDIALLGDNRTSEGPQGQALPIIWARSQVEDRMIEFIKPGLEAHERDELQAEVTELGLRHRLMTQWTSFVAVAKPVVNPGGAARSADVAVAQVDGVSDSAYPASALPQSGQPAAMPAGPQPQLAPAKNTLLVAANGGSFGGQVAPEPSSWVALLGIAATAAMCMRRRRAAH